MWTMSPGLPTNKKSPRKRVGSESRKKSSFYLDPGNKRSNVTLIFDAWRKNHKNKPPLSNRWWFSMGDFHPDKENSNVVNNMFAQINNSQRNKNKRLSTFSGVTKLISTKRNTHILQLFFAVFRHLPPKKIMPENHGAVPTAHPKPCLPTLLLQPEPSQVEPQVLLIRSRWSWKASRTHHPWLR